MSSACHLKVWGFQRFHLKYAFLNLFKKFQLSGEGNHVGLLSHPLTCPSGNRLNVRVNRLPPCFGVSSSVNPPCSGGVAPVCFRSLLQTCSRAREPSEQVEQFRPCCCPPPSLPLSPIPPSGALTLASPFPAVFSLPPANCPKAGLTPPYRMNSGTLRWPPKCPHTSGCPSPS